MSKFVFFFIFGVKIYMYLLNILVIGKFNLSVKYVFEYDRLYKNENEIPLEVQNQDSRLIQYKTIMHV